MSDFIGCLKIMNDITSEFPRFKYEDDRSFNWCVGVSVNDWLF